MELVAAFVWNGWQLSCGTGGSFRVERVAALPWNQWQDSPGIGGSFAVEYASIILRESNLRSEIDRMRTKYDDVIIDTGGRDTRSQRASLSLADVLLLPFNPRSLDIWTLENVEKLLEDIRTINPELRAVSFLNRADPVGSDNQDSRDILSEVSGIEFSAITIVNRKAFGKAVSLGLSVVELTNPDGKATREIVALYEYIFRAKIE